MKNNIVDNIRIRDLTKEELSWLKLGSLNFHELKPYKDTDRNVIIDFPEVLRVSRDLYEVTEDILFYDEEDLDFCFAIKKGNRVTDVEFTAFIRLGALQYMEKEIKERFGLEFR